MIGFAGLGMMGRAMASNLVRAGLPVLVWNRTAARTRPLADLGAKVAPDLDTLFTESEVVFLMLTDAAACDEVLAGRRLAGRTVINTSTLEPASSERLAAEVAARDVRYVEAPVSGSRVPAENGELVAMTAGDPEVVESVRPLFDPLCRQVVYCGPPPAGLVMKLAVNICLITQITGLAEAVRFAAAHDLELDRFAQVIGAGQLASPVVRVKTPKLVGRDFTPQASISDVWMNTRLITDAAAAAGIAAPLLDVCRDLYAETAGLGHSRDDMAAVLTAIENRQPRSA